LKTLDSLFVSKKKNNNKISTYDAQANVKPQIKTKTNCKKK